MAYDAIHEHYDSRHPINNHKASVRLLARIPDSVFTPDEREAADAHYEKNDSYREIGVLPPLGHRDFLVTHRLTSVPFWGAGARGEWRSTSVRQFVTLIEGQAEDERFSTLDPD